MASIKEHKKGGWRAIVHNSKEGIYTSKVCRTKGQAERWARDTEDSIADGTYNDNPDANLPFKSIIKRYIETVSINKKGYDAEASRLNAMAKRNIGKKKFSAITVADVVCYRKERKRQVKNDTIIRELNLISTIFNHARREWSMNIKNPALSKNVKRPVADEGRTRRLKTGEYQLMVDSLSAARNKQVLPFFLLAIETACRRSELLSLKWKDIDLDRQIADLHNTKNGIPRTVPLSSKAVDILKAIKSDSTNGKVFNMSANAVKCVWRRAVERAGIEGLRLHDMRHEAASRLFEKGLDSMLVAKVTGHKDLRMLERYTQVPASKIAKMLD